MTTHRPGLPEDLEDRLRKGLQTLPGEGGQALMAPRPETGVPLPRNADGGTPAAALLLLYPRGGIPHLLLTLRSAHLPLHRGQVSLPGGLREEEETLSEAALREAQEEVGLDPALARLLGPLTPLYIPPTNFLLHPFVATTSASPSWRPNPDEVERVLEIPLEEFRDPANRRSELRSLHGGSWVVPFFALGGEKVWGATAMILAEFLGVLERGAGSP
jgi:8-oxo-dGTP pyrophosphatase MutT (NUDIX family)